ncbi:hypothetical protein K7X08_037831 [Anisodus acutangulus]|uniref:Uncharacterized protein n=1 Tax=Anisodus acutangulus TaxID=402998 RepID=A0A9Q1MX70_9SOLA|nr:hypothetical protein K7X08_037831 [Anisodus acutangulus]
MPRKSVPTKGATPAADSALSLCGTTNSPVEDIGKRIMPQKELILTLEMFPSLPTNGPLRIQEGRKKKPQRGISKEHVLSEKGVYDPGPKEA